MNENPILTACREWTAATDDPSREAVRAKVREVLALAAPAPDPGLVAFDAAIAAASAAASESEARKLFARVTVPAPIAAPVLAELAATDASEPRPVLWRDGPGRWADAVLSAGEVAILASPGGLGKSTLVLELAIAAVTKGDDDPMCTEYGTACGLRVRSGPVVLVSYEDSTGRIAARYSSAMTGARRYRRRAGAAYGMRSAASGRRLSWSTRRPRRSTA